MKTTADQIKLAPSQSLGFEFGDSHHAESDAQPRAWGPLSFLFRRQASKRQLMLVFRQLSLLVETGIDVAEALEMVSASCKQGSLQDSLEEIYRNINDGISLSRAVEAESEVFGREVASSIQAGEASGKLVDVLRQIANQLEEDLQMKATVVGALAYPAILCMASVAVASILIWFVLPQFESSFESMGVTPPAFTELLLNTSSFIRENTLLVAGSLLGGMALLVLVIFQPKARQVFDEVCFMSPLIGTALRNLTIGRMFVSMGHLLANGISLLEVIQLVRGTTSHGKIRRLIESWEKDVVEGKGLTQSLDQFDFLPDGADAMIIMAERTGKLESVLSTAGTFYRTEGSNQLKGILKLSEPLIIIVLGVFVGVVVASVLLPMLDIQSASSVG